MFKNNRKPLIKRKQPNPGFEKPLEETADWRKMILEGTEAEKICAIIKLRKKQDADAIPVLIKALGDEQFEVRAQAAVSIAAIGVNDRQFEAIVRLVTHGISFAEVEGGLIALKSMGKADSEQLVDSFKDEKRRQLVARIFQGENVLNVLSMVVAKSNDSGARYRAAVEVLKIAKTNPENPGLAGTVIPLSQALEKGDDQIEMFAESDALSEICPDVEHTSWLCPVADALGEIRDPRAVPALVQTLEKSNFLYFYAWKSAAIALGKIAQVSSGYAGLQEAVPILAQSSDVPQMEVRETARWAIQKITQKPN